MEALQQFVEARAADLTAAASLATKAFETKTLPAWDDVPMSAVYTALAAVVLVQCLVALLTSRGRRVVFDTIETILAIALIVVLLAVVIGLPLGIVYLTLKAVSFLLSLAMGVPFVAGLVSSVTSSLGL